MKEKIEEIVKSKKLPEKIEKEVLESCLGLADIFKDDKDFFYNLLKNIVSSFNFNDFYKIDKLIRNYYNVGYSYLDEQTKAIVYSANLLRYSAGNEEEYNALNITDILNVSLNVSEVLEDLFENNDCNIELLGEG